MASAAAAFCGSPASAKALLQHVSREGVEARQSKTHGGSIFHVSWKLGMEILENILSSLSTSVYRLPFQKVRSQRRTCRSYKVIFSVQLTVALKSQAPENKNRTGALTCTWVMGYAVGGITALSNWLCKPKPIKFFPVQEWMCPS